MALRPLRKEKGMRRATLRRAGPPPGAIGARGRRRAAWSDERSAHGSVFCHREGKLEYQSPQSGNTTFSGINTTLDCCGLCQDLIHDCDDEIAMLRFV